jgi:hypothetical protein
VGVSVGVGEAGETNRGAVNAGAGTAVWTSAIAGSEDKGEEDVGVDGPALPLGSMFLIHAPMEPLSESVLGQSVRAERGWGDVQEPLVSEEHGAHRAFAPEPDRVRERGDGCCVA